MNTVTKGRLSYSPPEGVEIGLTIAPLGMRFLAQIVDLVLTYGAAILVAILLFWSGVLSFAAFGAFVVLLMFLIRIPYYILSELVWNGRTLGKRITGIRVVSSNGRRLTPHQVVARNLMKEVEIFTPISFIFAVAAVSPVMKVVMALWLIAIAIVPFVNKRRQRIGDILAGTLVVKRPLAVLLPDLAVSSDTPLRGYEFRAEHLDIYGRFELQTLETILREPPSDEARRQRVSAICQTILRKIGYDEKVPPNREWDFLMEFYRAQRHYLENRHLLGDRRENKFHPDAGGQPAAGDGLQR